jgi:hypothetical protein
MSAMNEFPVAETPATGAEFVLEEYDGIDKNFILCELKKLKPKDTMNAKTFWRKESSIN